MSEIKPVATWETHCKRNPSCAEQAHLYASEAKSIEIEELRAAYEALQKELTHWKANHADLKERLHVATHRTDLPSDRLPLFDGLKAENEAHAKQIEILKSFMRPCDLSAAEIELEKSKNGDSK